MPLDPFSMIGSLGAGLFSFLGANDASETSRQNALANIQAQKEINAENWDHSLYMAKNSLQMRKADAEAAGIHPLYAMGAPTMSFAPSQVGAGLPTSVPNKMAGVASAMQSMGQDLSRASAADVGPASKVAAVQTTQQITSNNLDLENKQLQNTLLKARIANLTQPATPPGVNFTVPENNKVEQRPPLMLFGKRWDTNPDTSPMKAWEDQYGDEGPVASTLPLAILANDLLYGNKPKDRSTARTDFSGLGSGDSVVGRWFNQLKGQRWVY